MNRDEALAGIREIPWPSWAQGPEVLAFVERIADGGEDVESLIDEQMPSFFAQGPVSAVAGHATPFMLRLLSVVNGERLSFLLGLLESIAEVERLRPGVAEGISQVRALFEHERVDVRTSAAKLLLRFPKEVPAEQAWTDAIVRMIGEEDDFPLISMEEALRFYPAAHPRFLDSILTTGIDVTPSRSSAYALGAALLWLAFGDGGKVPPELYPDEPTPRPTSFTEKQRDVLKLVPRWELFCEVMRDLPAMYGLPKDAKALGALAG